MFIGVPLNEFPLCTSPEMTETYNGDDVQYNIYIDQQLEKEFYIKQQTEKEIYIQQEIDFTLEN